MIDGLKRTRSTIAIGIKGDGCLIRQVRQSRGIGFQFSLSGKASL